MREVKDWCRLLGLALLAAGCSSDRARCETWCEYFDECVSAEVSCSDEKLDECADDVEDLSDDCYDAFASFADCLDENDNECSDVAESCRGEAAEFGEQCNGELD